MSCFAKHLIKTAPGRAARGAKAKKKMIDGFINVEEIKIGWSRKLRTSHLFEENNFF
jgi:hypothetical protein